MKEKIIFGGIGFAAGTLVGFLVGYKLLDKKLRKEYCEKLDRVTTELNAKETDSSDYDDYNDSKKAEDSKEYDKIISNLRYKVDEDTIDEENNEADTNTTENNPEDVSDGDISVEKEPPKKYRSPKPLGENEFDENEPDLVYPVKDIYYFMQSELLTDENGQLLNETDTIGNKLRGWGYMSGQGKDDIWVRNYELETDYHVHRKLCAIEDEFGEEQNE